MIEHILFPTDGSEHSRSALKHVHNIALQHNARVTVLTAYEFWEVAPVYNSTHVPIEKLKKTLIEVSQHILDTTRNELREGGVYVEGLLIHGNPKKAIVDIAQKEKSDLIVMGCRGMGTLTSLFMGSISDYVTHHAPCPVLVIR